LENNPINLNSLNFLTKVIYKVLPPQPMINIKYVRLYFYKGYEGFLKTTPWKRKTQNFLKKILF